MTTEPDLDDVAFLSGGGDSSGGRQTRNSVAVCSQKRALCITCMVIGSLLTTALIIAYAGPQNDCSCAGKGGAGYILDQFNSSYSFNPIATNGEPFPWLKLNLPTYVQPTRYMLTIHPNLTTLDVKGQVTIELMVEKEINFIVLHIHDLNITERAIVSSKGMTLKIIKVLEYPPRQQLYIEVKEKFRKNTNYTLNLRWYSKLVPEPEGFYVDQYTSENGQIRLLAATVFRPGGARKAFPCFDEPQFRTPFRVSVFRDRFHIGLSNSIVHATDDVGFYMGTGLLRDDFIETPPLPADAIVWIVSDFQRRTLETLQSNKTKTTTSSSLLTLTTPFKENFALKANNKPIRNITALMHSLNLHLITKNASVNENNKNISSLKQSTYFSERTSPSYTLYAPGDVLSLSNFILHKSRDVLEYVENWLQIKYPLSKIDFVALPSLDLDLISSLGVVVIRSSFLTDSSTVTTEKYQLSTIKIAESIIRQFFGGVTSPKIWKNNFVWDGLIKYLGILILAPLEPNWPIEERHLLQISTKALDIDAMPGCESIYNRTSENGINHEFYINKVSAIFSMLHTAIGDNNFKKCLGIFISNNRYKPAETSDLWATCSRGANGSKNIKEMIKLWLGQSGFPLLTVTKVGHNISITQKSFQASYSENMDYIYENKFTSISLTRFENKLNSTPWILPVNYVTNVKNMSDTLWFNTNVTFRLSKEIKWIKLNTNQNGYYRVLYNEENWNNIIDDLLIDHEILTPKDRIGLISDAFTLCNANLMPCKITMNLITYLPKEKNWGPMTTALKHLERWRRILKYSECFLLLSEFIKMTLSKPIIDLGWSDNGSEDIRLLRTEVLLAAVLWENTDSVSKSKSILNEFLSNGTLIPPNLREVVYTGAVLSGEYVYWQYCWNRFISLQGSTDGLIERTQILNALGKTKDAWLQNRLLSHATTLQTSEVIQLLQAVSGTSTGAAIACRFLQAKWYDLEQRLGRGSIDFAKVISAITQYGSTKFDYDELKSLAYRFGLGPGIEILNMTLNIVAANVKWVSKSQTSLYSWVETNGQIH